MEPQTTMTTDAVAAETMMRKPFDQPRWYLSKTAYNIRIRAESVREFIGDFQPKNILDIGCGDGSLSLPLLRSNNRLTLLDSSHGMLEIAAARVPSEFYSQVVTQNEDFMSAKLPNGTYDLVICVGVMAYIENNRTFVQKLASILRPGGHLIIECTDARHFITYFVRTYEAVRTRLGGKALPTVVHASSDLLAALTNSGFELDATFRYMLPLPGMRRLLPQEISYQLTRRLHGNAMHNRLAWLGNECLYHLQRHGQQPRVAT